jgi:hypothetical protein
VEKYCRAGQATDDNMAHAQFMLDTQGYKYTQSCCVILIVFPQPQWLHERVPCYVIRTLPVLLKISKNLPQCIAVLNSEFIDNLIQHILTL